MFSKKVNTAALVVIQTSARKHYIYLTNIISFIFFVLAYFEGHKNSSNYLLFLQVNKSSRIVARLHLIFGRINDIKLTSLKISKPYLTDSLALFRL